MMSKQMLSIEVKRLNGIRTRSYMLLLQHNLTDTPAVQELTL